MTSPSRRVVLVGALGGLALSATGCGVRLEDGVSLPFVPTPALSPEDVEVGALRMDAARLAEAASRSAVAAGEPAAGQLAGALATVHQAQVARLSQMLSPRAAAASASPSPVPTVTAGPDLVALERASLPPLRSRTGTTRERRPLMAALAAQRHAAVLLLGSTVPEAEPGSALLPAELLEPMHALYAARYRFGILGAAARDEQRTQVTQTLTWVSARIDLWRVQAQVEPALGYPMTAQGSSPEAVAQAAQSILTELLEAWGRALPAVSARDPQAAAGGLAPMLGDIEAHRYGWGAALAPFPGLS